MLFFRADCVFPFWLLFNYFIFKQRKRCIQWGIIYVAQLGSFTHALTHAHAYKTHNKHINIKKATHQQLLYSYKHNDMKRINQNRVIITCVDQSVLVFLRFPFDVVLYALYTAQDKPKIILYFNLAAQFFRIFFMWIEILALFMGASDFFFIILQRIFVEQETACTTMAKKSILI